MSNPDLNFTSPLSTMQLVSEVCIAYPYRENRQLRIKSLRVSAMWDTGAVISGISRTIATKLGLKPRERTALATTAGITQTFSDIVLLYLFLNGYVIPVKAAVFDTMPGQCNDFIIGMDVIQCGDLSIQADHLAGSYNISFKPYPGAFRPIEEIFSQ